MANGRLVRELAAVIERWATDGISAFVVLRSLVEWMNARGGRMVNR